MGMGRWVRQKGGIACEDSSFNFTKGISGPMKETIVNRKVERGLFGRM